MQASESDRTGFGSGLKRNGCVVSGEHLNLSEPPSSVLRKSAPTVCLAELPRRSHQTTHAKPRVHFLPFPGAFPELPRAFARDKCDREGRLQPRFAQKRGTRAGETGPRLPKLFPWKRTRSRCAPARCRQLQVCRQRLRHAEAEDTHHGVKRARGAAPASHHEWINAIENARPRRGGFASAVRTPGVRESNRKAMAGEEEDNSYSFYVTHSGAAEQSDRSSS